MVAEGCDSEASSAERAAEESDAGTPTMRCVEICGDVGINLSTGVRSESSVLIDAGTVRVGAILGAGRGRAGQAGAHTSSSHSHCCLTTHLCHGPRGGAVRWDCENQGGAP